MARNNNGMRLSRFVANETKLIEEILDGRDIPNYYNIKEFTKLLFKYYVEERGIEYSEAIENICNFLDSRNILYSKKEINTILTWYDPKKIIPLRRHTAPIVFSNADVNVLKSVEKREGQRLLFSFMLIAKFQRLYTKVSEPNCIYYDAKEVGALLGMNANSTRNAIKEIGLCGFILAPLDKNCIIVNCLSEDDSVALEIYDFEPSMVNDMFIKLVGRQEQKIMAIPLDDEEDWILIDSINGVKRVLGINTVGDVFKASKLDRLHSKGYMFFQVEDGDDDAFLDFIAWYYRRNIANNYRAMKKDGTLVGTKMIFCNKNIIRDIYSKFMNAIEQNQ